jgi:hypothetical protein
MRSALRHRGRLPGVSRPAALAERLSVSEVWRNDGVAGSRRTLAVRRLWSTDVGHSGDGVPRHTDAADRVVSRHVVGHQLEGRHERADLAAFAGPGQLLYQTAWAWLHKLRRAMVRPGRDRLSGEVEVDETLLGGLGGAQGRSTATKALIVVAAEAVGRGTGRIRMRRIPDGSAPTLQAFVEEAIERGSTVHTDGWDGYARVKANGYRHRVSFLRGDTPRWRQTSCRVCTAWSPYSSGGCWAPIKAPSVARTWTTTWTSSPSASTVGPRVTEVSYFSDSSNTPSSSHRSLTPA